MGLMLVVCEHDDAVGARKAEARDEKMATTVKIESVVRRRCIIVAVSVVDVVV